MISKRLKFLSFLLVFFVVLVMSILYITQISKEKSKISFNYNIFGCGEKEEKVYRAYENFNKIDFKILNNSLILLHNLSYYCCANIQLYLYTFDDKNYKIIKIKEKNEGDVCRCICNYTINMNVSNLEKGLYKVEILGIEFNEIPAEVLFEKYFSIE